MAAANQSRTIAAAFLQTTYCCLSNLGIPIHRGIRAMTHPFATASKLRWECLKYCRLEQSCGGTTLVSPSGLATLRTASVLSGIPEISNTDTITVSIYVHSSRRTSCRIRSGCAHLTICSQTIRLFIPLTPPSRSPSHIQDWNAEQIGPLGEYEVDRPWMFCMARAEFSQSATSCPLCPCLSSPRLCLDWCCRTLY